MAHHLDGLNGPLRRRQFPPTVMMTHRALTNGERHGGKRRREARLLSARSKSSKGVAHGGKVPVCPSEGLIQFRLSHICRGTYGRKRREPHIRHQAARCLGAKQAENR